MTMTSPEDIKQAFEKIVSEPDSGYDYPVPVAFYGEREAAGSADSGTAAAKAAAGTVAQPADTAGRGSVPDFLQTLCTQVCAQLSSPGVCIGAADGADAQRMAAHMIGRYNISALVIDCAAAAADAPALQALFAGFYTELRRYHPYIPVFFLTAPGEGAVSAQPSCNQLLQQLCRQAAGRGEHVFIVDTGGEDPAEELTAQLKGCMADTMCARDRRVEEQAAQLKEQVDALYAIPGMVPENSAYEQTLSFYQNGELGLSALGKSFGAWLRYKAGRKDDEP